ncbi:HNH endonuclease [Microbispora amethystogenes]|uniref:HNH endonuclease n=1 Tax=Microbispora amethystogenes TaxID=1427754 RepID=UPI0033C1B43D
MSLESRFWSKVDKRGPDDCWPWTGATNQHGYGVMRPEGRRSGPTVKAHRVSLTLAGIDPDGWCVLHSCDNRKCVNPAHLRLGTKADNTRDMLTKQRGLVGQRNGHAKLTDTQAAEIRRRRLAGERRDVLAAEFHVSGATITRIANGEGWRHVA